MLTLGWGCRVVDRARDRGDGGFIAGGSLGWRHAHKMTTIHTRHTRLFF